MALGSLMAGNHRNGLPGWSHRKQEEREVLNGTLDKAKPGGR